MKFRWNDHEKLIHGVIEILEHIPYSRQKSKLYKNKSINVYKEI